METDLRQKVLLLKSLRGKVAECRMTTLTIVVELDEFENDAASLGAGRSQGVVEGLRLVVMRQHPRRTRNPRGTAEDGPGPGAHTWT